MASTTPTLESASTSNGASERDTETVTQIQMAGLTVLMIKKKDQVIYKLPDHMSVQSLSKDQRERLLAEINLLHHQQTTAQALAATMAQTQQVQKAQTFAQAQAQAQAQDISSTATPTASGNRLFTPNVRQIVSQHGHMAGTKSISDQVNQGDVNSNSHLVNSSSPAASTPSTPGDTSFLQNQQKTTRRYNKTGKYSKKKLMQQQQADRALLQDLLQSGLPTLEHKRQLKLLSDWHQALQSLDVQVSSTNTFREHEQTVHRVLAHGKPVDIKTQSLAKQNRVEAEKSLERLQNQVALKETIFQEQCPQIYQQLLVAQRARSQEQHQLQGPKSSVPVTFGLAKAADQGLAAFSFSGSNSASAGALYSSTSASQINVPKTIEERLQLQIGEHHDLDRNVQALQAYRRKSNLIRQYRRLVKVRATGGTIQNLSVLSAASASSSGSPFTYSSPTTASDALELLALRCMVEDERAEHVIMKEQYEFVLSQAKAMSEDLEKRQAMVLQQQQAKVALIEQQQRLMLERQRQEEVQRLRQEQEKERQRKAKEDEYDATNEEQRRQHDVSQQAVMMEHLRKIQEAQQQLQQPPPGQPQPANQDFHQLRQLLHQQQQNQQRQQQQQQQQEVNAHPTSSDGLEERHLGKERELDRRPPQQPQQPQSGTHDAPAVADRRMLSFEQYDSISTSPLSPSTSATTGVVAAQGIPAEQNSPSLSSSSHSPTSMYPSPN
ncbi:hypothetical protein BGZ83_010138 [Gryganskiella cystojenkinii]|nr:hypothetical protein BGZ83_010138 [Gryganskiella cystojenkinii]